MSDSADIYLFIGFELLLVFGTAYSIARRRAVFGTRGSSDLPASRSALVVILTVLAAVLTFIGGLSPWIASTLAVSAVASWLVMRRLADLPAGAARPARPAGPDERELRVKSARIVATAFVLVAVIVGGGGYTFYTYAGMPAETARVIIVPILAVLSLLGVSWCLSLLREDH